MFDLYETLITYFDPAWSPPPQTIAARLGVPEPVWAEHWRSLQMEWEAGTIESYSHTLTRLCTLAEVQPSPELLSQLHDERVQRSTRPFSTIEPAIIALLTELKRINVKTAVITNASNLDTAPWLTCTLAPFIDEFVASHSVRLLKPDPEIYALACQRLNVQRQEAIFVGDGGSNELQGARDAGVEALWASWFIDRWPAGLKPNGFPGDAWRENPDRHTPPFPRLRTPVELLAHVERELPSKPT